MYMKLSLGFDGGEIKMSKTFRAYFKPYEFEADNEEEANELISSGDWMDSLECNLIEEVKSK